MSCPDELLVQRKYFLELDDRKIRRIHVAVLQSLIVLLDGLIDRIESRRIGLDHLKIIIGDILLGTDILRNDPLA